MYREDKSMNAQEQPTCGKGLAENSAFPAQIGKVVAAMAENLETHMKALDLTDKHSSAEYTAYENLVKELKQSALQLHLAAKQMAGYRDLPMGRHIEKEMIHPRVRETFDRFINQKQELLSLLQQTADRDQAILEMMGAHNS
jgi:hypothetical protein